ncbi:helix-turn-helix transcriptional regulator [Bosea sp. Tri-44]|uniref:helix-turn-helix domain-containing protein n=1 Tax=Bosea sp. Tri-44 TaxID=1972137 RepID=UPI0019D70569|nr:helix-turn-helix transcriptional regulator [Bosea sp. Tri-44]
MASTQPELYTALLQALIQARKDAGITQVELATQIGRRQTFVSKYETEERRLDVAEYIANREGDGLRALRADANGRASRSAWGVSEAEIGPLQKSGRCAYRLVGLDTRR